MKHSLLRRKEEDILLLVDSEIAGKGILAQKAIPKGTRITEYKGKKRKCRLSDEADPYICLMDLGNEWVIDPRTQGNLARFINHSCAPNCKLNQIGQRIYVESIQSIKAGQELTYDYNLNLSGEKEENSAEEIALYRCLCGSKKCRGSMLSKAELAKIPG